MERSFAREIERLKLDNGNGNGGGDFHGRGPCGESARAATLCPSFRRAGIVGNPSWRDRAKASLDAFFTGVPQA